MTILSPDSIKPGKDKTPDYRTETIPDVIKGRLGWLICFFGGLVLAALVVAKFEDLLRKQVELSYFVPLLIGHGGNSGSQTVSTVIR